MTYEEELHDKIIEYVKQRYESLNDSAKKLLKKHETLPVIQLQWENKFWRDEYTKIRNNKKHLLFRLKQAVGICESYEKELNANNKMIKTIKKEIKNGTLSEM